MTRFLLCGFAATVSLLASPMAAPLATPLAAQSPARRDSVAPPPAAVRGTGPNGVTLRCRDGSYPAPLAPASACDGKGGVLARFPLQRTPAPLPPRAAPVRPAAPATVQAEPATTAPTRRANVMIPAERPPADATLLCGDGSFVRADTSSVRCAANGGVKLRFAVRQPR